MRLRDERRMSDLIQVADDYYIRATSARVDDRVRVLKDGDTFVVFDRRGDIHPWGRAHHGLYHDGTRFLSWPLPLPGMISTRLMRLRTASSITRFNSASSWPLSL